MEPTGAKYIENNSNISIDKDAPKSLNTLKSNIFGLYWGLGFYYPLKYNFGLNCEFSYNLKLNNVIENADWQISYMSFLFGLKYHIY